METTTNKHPQPRPILGVCFSQIFLPAHKVPHLKPYNRPPLAILKYFPKYIDSLPSNLSNLKPRIKRLKLIKNIPDDHPNHTLRVLIANKRKNIQFASGVESREYKGGYNKRALDLLKMLPNVQRVEFCVRVPSFRDGEKHKQYQATQYYWISRMSSYLRRMTNLKHLKLSDRGFNLLPLLSKLNSFDAMMGRLEVFSLNLGLISPKDFPDFQALLGYKTALKHLTHLSLHLPEDERLFPVFQLLPDLCPRLLSFTYFIKKGENSEGIRVLKCLQGFQKLQKLSLCCESKLDAFRHCKFPMSLRFLDLYFVNADWRSLVTKEAFYDKQEGLKNLENLQIFLSLYHPVEDEDSIKGFMKDLLSRILTLRELKIEFTPIYQEGNPSFFFDISHFLSCLQHLSHSLQRLTIQDDHFRYSFTNFLETQAFHFPELSYLSIKSGTFSSLPVLEKTLKLAQAKPDAPPPEVKLKRMKIDSCKSLLKLFDCLKMISEKQIELVIFYEDKRTDDGDEEYFKENYEKVKQYSKNLKNVSLDIQFSKGWQEFRWKKELMSLEKLFKKFVTSRKSLVIA